MRVVVVLGLVLVTLVATSSAAFSGQLNQVQFGCAFPDVPAEKAESWIGPLNGAFKRAGITDVQQASAFLALASAATDSWSTFKEYAHSVFGVCISAFGDCAYTGRGVFMMRGRSTYLEVGASLGKPYANDPEMVSALPDAFLSAGEMWKLRGWTQWKWDDAAYANAASALKLSDVEKVKDVADAVAECLSDPITCVTYVSAEGDTVQSISRLFSIPEATIIELNNLPKDGNEIPSGTTLSLECTESRMMMMMMATVAQ